MVTVITFPSVAIQPPSYWSPKPNVNAPPCIHTTGKPLYEFRGIRYGKPPVGPLRFKQPVPVKKWEDTLDATTFGASCPQFVNEMHPIIDGYYNNISFSGNPASIMLVCKAKG
jgi:hypothetical protein